MKKKNIRKKALWKKVLKQKPPNMILWMVIDINEIFHTKTGR